MESTSGGTLRFKIRTNIFKGKSGQHSTEYGEMESTSGGTLRFKIRTNIFKGKSGQHSTEYGESMADKVLRHMDGIRDPTLYEIVALKNKSSLLSSAHSGRLPALMRTS
ncbi:hypothetical protein QE152_g35056 [Popillia japonica]|uniref:Uncharacterized protein n=1 Tax=Popillia japonica TaxID=7064 RepID=A0AAW1ISN2_POPJA